MAVKHSSVVAGKTATSLTASVADTTRNNYDLARTITVSNPSSVDVFIGGSDVTTTSYGYKLVAGANTILRLGPTDEPFVVAPDQGLNPQPSVNVLHVGV